MKTNDQGCMISVGIGTARLQAQTMAVTLSKTVGRWVSINPCQRILVALGQNLQPDTTC